MRFIYGVLILVGIIIIPYEIVWNVSRVRWIRDFHHRYDSLVESGKISIPSVVNDTGYLQLQNQISFLKARISLARVEPLGISVNLPDSVALLEIRGVTVHTSKIQKFHVDRKFKSIHPFYLSQELAAPLKVISYSSTIPREPILIKVAPKDTTQVSSSDFVADTASTAAVCFQLSLENGMKLTVLESHKGPWWWTTDIRKFIISTRLPEIKNNFLNLFRFRLMETHPEIIVVMSRNDAKTLLRALPEHGMVALRVF